MVHAWEIIEALSLDQAQATFARYGVRDADRLAAAPLRVAYIKLVKDHHPDTGGHTAAMQEINAAYDVLKLRAAHAGTWQDPFRAGGTTRPAWTYPSPPKPPSAKRKARSRPKKKVEPDAVNIRVEEFCLAFVRMLKKYGSPFDQVRVLRPDTDTVSFLCLDTNFLFTFGWDHTDDVAMCTDVDCVSSGAPAGLEEAFKTFEGRRFVNGDTCADALMEAYFNAAGAGGYYDEDEGEDEEI